MLRKRKYIDCMDTSNRLVCYGYRISTGKGLDGPAEEMLKELNQKKSAKCIQEFTTLVDNSPLYDFEDLKWCKEQMKWDNNLINAGCSSQNKEDKDGDTYLSEEPLN